MKKTLLILLSLIISLNTALANTRGIRKVEIKTKSGEKVGLYAESHALVIGVSNYTNGWPKLPGVIGDVSAVSDALETHGFKVQVVENPANYNALDDTCRGQIRNGSYRKIMISECIRCVAVEQGSKALYYGTIEVVVSTGKNVKMSGWLEREDTDLLFFENIFKEENENERPL